MNDARAGEASAPGAGTGAAPADNSLRGSIDQLLEAGPLGEPAERARGGNWGDWQPVLDAWRRSAEGQALMRSVEARVAAGAVIYPSDVFRALALTGLADTRVVILGQDPYHGTGQADGLAFSVPRGVRPPPSLRNILVEQARDLGRPIRRDGDLSAWAAGGVLLLNTSLTVEAGRPGSHARLGWSALTDRIVQALAADQRPKVFLLWGAHAQARASWVAAGARGHVVLAANHPSPLAARRPPVPFVGCRHFLRAVETLSRTPDPWSWPD